MGCCGSLIKYLLFIFNFVFVLCGIALIAVGAVLLSDVSAFSSIVDEVDSVFTAPPIVLVVVGCLIFFIAFLGCCGAIRESKWMLLTFGVCLLVIFIIQFVVGIYVVVSFSESNVQSTLLEIFNRHTQNSMEMFDALQNSLDCCGVKGVIDYTTWGDGTVPLTCCPTQSTCTVLEAWPTGCAEAFQNWVHQSGKYIGGVAIGLSVVEIVGALVAFFQARSKNSSPNSFQINSSD